MTRPKKKQKKEARKNRGKVHTNRGLCHSVPTTGLPREGPRDPDGNARRMEKQALQGFTGRERRKK